MRKVVVLALMCTSLGAVQYAVPQLQGKPARMVRQYEQCVDSQTKAESVWFDWKMEMDGKALGQGREKAWDGSRPPQPR